MARREKKNHRTKMRGGAWQKDKIKDMEGREWQEEEKKII